MGLWDKYKQLDKRFEKGFSKFNLGSLYPEYFNKNVFRVFFLLLLLVPAFNFYLNDYSLTAVVVTCNDPQGCLNPVYDCANEYGDVFYSVTRAVITQNCVSYLDDEWRNKVCSIAPCDKKYLKYGAHYGRSDFLASNSVLVMFLIVLFSFIVNHLYYMLRLKNGLE